MDDAIWALLQKEFVSPHEVFMKAIDKNRFKKFLPPEEEHLGDAAGAVSDDEQRQPGNFVKRAEPRTPRR
jgi:twitching motility protein PilT